VFVRQIQVTGSTVFSEAELAAVTAPYVNRAVTSEDLEALRLALTRLYVEKGYINSGAILPDQTVVDGMIRFHIIEGELTSATVSGNRWFRAGYLRQRLTLDVKPPLNLGALQTRLQYLQQDDRIERLQAELRPGVRLGESELYVRVEERLPFFVALEFNNYQAPTVGAERGLLTVAHRNLTGHGDVFSFTYGRSEGLKLQIDTGYALPLTPRDTTISLRYRRNSSSVVEERFAALDIDSRSEVFSLTLRHPFYRTLQREFALALSGEYLESATFLLGEPFSFSPGADAGKTRDTALRFAQEWLDRTPDQVLALRSRFSLGIDALGATIHEDSALPDGRFFAWLGQFQWARRVSPQDIQLLLRLDVQLTTDPLLPLEQIAIGGRFSVRGYRENQLVRDNGLLASLEARLPVLRNKRWAEFMQVVPFVDFGWGWNQKVATPDPTTLVSVGLGLRWAATLHMAPPVRSQFEIFWGYKLKDVDTEGGDLQDLGLHLQFVVAAF
jgi:hemolysin activation/secretion protein